MDELFSFKMKVQKSKSMSSKSSMGRHYSAAGAWEQQMSPSNWPSSPIELKPSLSDPALAPSAVHTATAVKVNVSHCCSTKWYLCLCAETNVPDSQCSHFQKSNKKSYQSSFQSQKSMRTQVKRESSHFVSNGTQMSVSKTGFIRPPSAQSQTDGKMGTIKIPSKLEQSSA